MLSSKKIIDKNKEQIYAKWGALWMWRLVRILYTRIWIASFRQSFWITICAETWWTAVWELPSVRFNSSRLEALVVVATCGCGSSLVVAVLRSPFSCVTCSPPSSPVFVSVLLLLFESRDFWLLAKFSSRCSSILWIWGDQWGFDPAAFKTAEVEKRDLGKRFQQKIFLETWRSQNVWRSVEQQLGAGVWQGVSWADQNCGHWWAGDQRKTMN